MCEDVVKQFFHELNSVYIARDLRYAINITINRADKSLILYFYHRISYNLNRTLR